MTRRHLTFDCAGSRLVGTLDEAPGATGLLIVSGGNELRSGPWGGQALLAARVAKAGFPVFRFDRRGIGDSEGMNGGFRSAADDLAASLAAFRRACPAMARVVGMGNCDAASALMLAGGRGFDALLLGNPWTFDEGDASEAPPAAVRAHYRQRLADPAAILRLLTGKVSLRKLLGSLRQAAAPAAEMSVLARQMNAGLSGYPAEVRFLIAERDRTGQAFMAGCNRNDPRLQVCAGATHSFVEPEAREWLFEQVLEVLAA